MNKHFLESLAATLIVGLFLVFTSCSSTAEKAETEVATTEVASTVYPSDVIPFFDKWRLILGDGSNVGVATDYENKDYFYTAEDDAGQWVVFKAPNGGSTHGSSNNTRTELA